MTRPIVWTIAGTDPSGGAGIQADLKTMNMLGVHGCSVITAVLAQNTRGVAMIEYPSQKMLSEQIGALENDMPPVAIKIGMLGNAHTVANVSHTLERLANAYTVWDPVMISSSGTRLLEPAARDAAVANVLPLLDLLTPNIAEAEDIAGLRIREPAHMEDAAGRILERGVRSVLIKGGHAGGDFCHDFWSDGRESAWITSRKQDRESHGSGCTLSSAIASCVALGFDALDAVIVGKSYVNQGIRLGCDLGQSSGPLTHGGWPSCPEDLPWLTSTAEEAEREFSFPDCGSEPLGMYPLVDSLAWVQRLLALGVRTIQLRIKDPHAPGLREETQTAINAARMAGCRLFINDYWELAIELGAYGVHLGQEDLDSADLDALIRAKVRLGTSNYSYAELARSNVTNPSYVALGPVFPSPSKAGLPDAWGVEGFARMAKLASRPVVAIGGITLEQANEVIQAGADGIAMISDVTEATDPDARVKGWLAAFSLSSLRRELPR